MKYIFNPFISFYFSINGDRLLLFEPLKKMSFEIQEEFLLGLIQYCKVGRKKNEIIDRINESLSLTDQDLNEVFLSLVSKNFLVKEDISSKRMITAKQEWFSYGWGSSFYYHIASKNFRFLDYSKDTEVLKDQQLMEHYIKTDQPLSVYKEYRTKKFYPLIDPKNFKSIYFPPNLNKVESLDKEKLSFLLYSTFGEIFSAKFPVVGKILAKTSPSGGARHPSEAYLILLKNVGIPKGIYHYSVKRNGLELLSDIADEEEIKKSFYKTSHIKEFNPEAIIVISSIFKRNMWRYREIRTFRVIFLDIGHLLSTLRTIIKSLGLDVLINHSFNDIFVQKLLGLNSGKERPLYCAIIGNYKKDKD